MKFSGEEGVDEGGLSREFFQLIVKECFSPNYGMFLAVPDCNVFWFRPSCLTDLSDEFELIGVPPPLLWPVVAAPLMFGNLQIFATYLMYLEIAEHWGEYMHRFGNMLFRSRLATNAIATVTHQGPTSNARLVRLPK